MRHRQTGVAIVEFALIVPLLLLLSFTATEFGRALYQYNILAKSVRSAARYLSFQAPGTHQAEAQNLVVYGNTAGTGAPLAPNLSLSNVTGPTWQTAGSNPLINTVTIGITGYTFHSLFASVFGISFGDVTFNPISATVRSPI